MPGFVTVGLHWEDCRRNPTTLRTTITDERGRFEQELESEDGIFEACISVHGIPFDTFPEKTVEAGFLTMQEPDSHGFPRDSVRVEIVFE